ncbi:MAG TPA: FlgD immunoglobulin-like domain containing protein, partial [Spirochaetia bacterium]|nr:FlgD immunoglobulin-like domain containing protein [Spirochaetia bacterium]
LFSSTVDGLAAGAQTLDLAAGTGTVKFGAAVGATALGAVTVTSDAGLTLSSTFAASSLTESAGTGTASIAAAITTNGVAGINLTATQIDIADTTLDASTGGGRIRLNGAVLLSSASAGSVLLNSSDTTNGVSVTGALTTTAANALSVTAPGGPVSFGSTVATSVTPLATLTLALDGTLTLGGGASSVHVTGAVTLSGSTAAISIGVSGGAGTLQISNNDLAALGAAGSLVIGLSGSQTGTVNWGDNSSAPLGVPATIYADGASGVLSFGNSAVSNLYTSDQALQLTATTIQISQATTVQTKSTTGANVTFTGPIDSSSGAHSLTITAGTGTVTVSGIVGTSAGSANNLSSFTVTSAASAALSSVFTSGAQSITASAITLNGANYSVSTSGAGVTFSGPVTLGANTAVATAGTAATDLIDFTSTIDGSKSLGLNAGAAGPVTVGGTVGTSAGNANNLSSFTVTNAVSAALNSVFTSGAQSVTASSITLNGANYSVSTTGAGVTFSGPVTLGANTAVATAGTASTDLIDFTSTIDGTKSLGLNAGTAGPITVGGKIGSTTPISTLGVSASGSATFSGLGISTADGVTGTVSVNSSGAVTLNGADYRSGGNQAWTAATKGVRVVLSSSSSWGAGLAAGLISFPGTALFVDSPGVTVKLLTNVTAKDFIFYRGTLNLNARTVTTTADFAVFGNAAGHPYSATDPDWSGANNRFAFLPASTFVYYPGAGTYTPSSGAFSTSPSAAFSPLDGSSISVGGNFYDNGADLTGAAAWNLTVPASAGLSPVFNTTSAATADQWGPLSAVALNATVSYSTVTSGSGNIAAASPSVGQTNNNVTNGLNNTLYTWNASTGAQTQAGWNFGALSISSAKTVWDNVIAVTFNEPVENSSGEIASAIGELMVNGGATAFTAAYSAFTSPAAKTAVGTQNHLLTVYLETSSATWNTDSIGSGATSSPSTNAVGITRSTVPNLTMFKGMLYSAGGSTMGVNYGKNTYGMYTATADGTGPVLYQIDAGRAVHNEPASTNYDSHNFFTLHYSEPVTIGGLTVGSTNARSETTFTTAAQWGGYITTPSGTAGGAVDVAGYFQFTPGGSDPNQGPIVRGSRDGNPSTDALYRTDAYTVDIYLSGYLASANHWPGWHSDVPDPSLASAISVSANANITDASGNAINSLVSPVVSSTPEATLVKSGFTVQSTTAAGFTVLQNTQQAAYTVNGAAVTDYGWDVNAPQFSVYTPASTYNYYEIVSHFSLSNGLLDGLQFFIRDNAAAVSGAWNPTASPSYHPDGNVQDGIRDSTTDYTGTDPTISAFSIGVVGSAATNVANLGFSTIVSNTQFGGVSINTVDDPYFALNIDATSVANTWGPTSSLYVSYDYTKAYLTDQAGNLVQPTPTPIGMRAIEKQPPLIQIALSSPSSTNMYVQFTEPVFGNPATSSPRTDITAGSFTITGTASPISITGVQVISRDANGGISSAFLTLSRAFTANEELSAVIGAATATSVYDAVGNSMLLTTRPVTDVGIGVASPIWASDGVHVDTANGALFAALRVFDGTGTLFDRDITLQAGILASSYTSLPLRLYYDINPPASALTSSGYWLPTVIDGLNTTADSQARELSPYQVTGSTSDFLIPGNDSKMSNGVAVQFFLRIGNLYTARLSNANDPRSLVPWSFGIQAPIEQRSHVTILGNIVNPDKGDKTVLTYTIPTGGMVTVTVFALDGDVVNILQRGPQAAGSYMLSWNGTNFGGRAVARGIYFVRVVAPGIDEYRKVLIVR